MIQIRKAKQTTLTTQITLESETVNQLRSNIALGLLTGGFNSLREYSRNRTPIDLKKLEVMQEKFYSLISEVENEMNIDILSIDKF